MSDNMLPHEKAIAQHVIAHVVESNFEIHGSGIPEGVDIDWYDWDIQYMSGSDTAVMVHAEQDFTQSGAKVSGGFHHPPEYEQHEGTIHADFRVDWGDDPLGGDCELYIEVEGGAPSPPDPEPEWRDI